MNARKRPFASAVSLALALTSSLAAAKPMTAPERPPTNAQIDALPVATFDGKPATLKTYRAAVTVIDMWTDSCPPCLKELPVLQKVADSYASDHDVSIVALSFDPTGEHAATPTDKARAEAARMKLGMPTLWDPTMASMKAFITKTGLAFPALIFIDRAGKVTIEQGFDSKMSEADFVAHERQQIEATRGR